MINYKDSANINGQFVRNASTTGYGEKTETFTLTGDSPCILELEEKVAASSTPTASLDGTPAEIIPYHLAPVAGEIAMNRKKGLLKYSVDDAGKVLTFTYDPAGTVFTAGKLEVMLSTGVAEHTHPISEVEGLQEALNEIEGTAGVSGYSGYSGFSGFSGFSGATGASGYSGYSGASGRSGYSGFSGISGFSGPNGPLNILTDVTITSAADYHVLQYEGASSQWKNHYLSGTANDTFVVNALASTPAEILFSNHSTPGSLIWYPTNAGVGYGGTDACFELSDELYVVGDIKSFGNIEATGDLLGTNATLSGGSTTLLSMVGSTTSSSITYYDSSQVMNLTANNGIVFDGVNPIVFNSGLGNGSIEASSFVGSGTSLTGVAKLSGGNTFSGNQNINGVLTLVDGGSFAVINSTEGDCEIYDGTFWGNGGGLTNLNAGNISSGSLADARLSSNVPLKNAANVFTGATQTFSGTRMLMNSSGRSTIHFGQNAGGVNPPSTNANGLKIKLYGSTTDNSLSAGEYGIGIEGGNQYYVTGVGYKWYAGGSLSTVGMSLQGSNLTVAGNFQASGSLIKGRYRETFNGGDDGSIDGYGADLDGHTTWGTAYVLPTNRSEVIIRNWDGSTEYDFYAKLPDPTALEHGDGFRVSFGAVSSAPTKHLRVSVVNSDRYLSAPNAYCDNTSCWKLPFQKWAWWEFYVAAAPNTLKKVWSVRIGYLPNLGTWEAI